MEYRLVDTGDLKAISKALKQHADGKQIRKELQRELGQITGPMVARVRQAWLSAPSRSAEPKLRRALAKATWAQARFTGKQAGVNVRTDGRRMPSGMRSLPGYAEGIRRRPWRHPVYGDRETWVTQQPFPRFYNAVQPDEAEARRAVQQAVDRVLDKIARA
jgi:hypothetical protein